jgi:predicted flap endonuclease-1-like 5' DNA nuclease
MPYPICVVDGVSPGIAKKLLDAKIRTTAKLLRIASTPQGRKSLSKQTGLDAAMILRCANMADRMRIKGIGRESAELLEAAGVDTVRELRYRNPANLASRMKAATKNAKLARPLPSEKVLARWIDDARKLKLEIRYK